MSVEGSVEVDSLLKKKRSRAAYKGHFSKLEKDVTVFLNDFVPGNLLHISKLKSFKNNIIEQNEIIKKLNDNVLELVSDDEFENEMNNNLIFNDKFHDIISRIDTALSIPATLSKY